MALEKFVQAHPRIPTLLFGFLLGFVFGSGAGAWLFEDVFANSTMMFVRNRPLLATVINGLIGGLFGVLFARNISSIPARN